MMNNLINIQNKSSTETINISRVEIGGQFFDYIDLFELASKLSYEVSEYGLDNLLNLIRIAKSIVPKDKNVLFLEESVRQTIMKNFKDSLPTEFDIHNMARKRIHKVLEGSKVIKKKNCAKHQPDLWIQIKKQEIPIEVKLDNFDYKALKQLERYMRFYNCKKGIAIANKLTTELPDSIEFISIKELEG